MIHEYRNRFTLAITPHKTLTRKQLDVILTLVLGDGYLQAKSNSYALQVYHSEAQKDYVLWKMDMINKAMDVDVNLRQYVYGDSHRAGFDLMSKLFKQAREIAYPKGTKDAVNILNNISKKGRKLAIMKWLMDDASATKGTIRFWTCSYDEAQCEEIINIMKSTFGLKDGLTVHKQGKNLPAGRADYNYIAIDRYAMFKMWKQIKDTLMSIPSMAKKFASVDRIMQKRYSVELDKKFAKVVKHMKRRMKDDKYNKLAKKMHKAFGVADVQTA